MQTLAVPAAMVQALRQRYQTGAIVSGEGANWSGGMGVLLAAAAQARADALQAARNGEHCSKTTKQRCDVMTHQCILVLRAAMLAGARDCTR